MADSKLPPDMDLEPCYAELKRLPTLRTEEQAAVFERILQYPGQEIRQRLVSLGAVLFPDDLLVSFLRNGADDVLRNAGLEMLKMRARKNFNLALGLLKDTDSDIVLQGVLIMDHLGDPRALEPLRRLLHYPDSNVVQAAIVAIGHVGDPRATQDLLPFLDGDLWLRMAAIQAIGDLRPASALTALQTLLDDELVGSLAAEALAKIGGEASFRALAARWLMEPDREFSAGLLGFIAHVTEGLTEPCGAGSELLNALAKVLKEGSEETRTYAARALLSLGCEEHARESLEVVMASREGGGPLPQCLRQRGDLLGLLLGREGLCLEWGLELASYHPKLVDVPTLIETMRLTDCALHLDSLNRILSALAPDPRLAQPLMEFYGRLSPDDRLKLTGALRRMGPVLVPRLQRGEMLDRTARMSIGAHTGEKSDELLQDIAQMSNAERAAFARQILDCHALLDRLPWKTWLESDPDSFVPIAAQAVVSSRSAKLLALLRGLLADSPYPDIIRALGETRDSESVPALVSLYSKHGPFIDSLILDALGRIGGATVRRAFACNLPPPSSGTVGVYYKALANCAVEADTDEFRHLCQHEDYLVRRACIDVLARFPSAENHRYLSLLAADPVKAVAQRALAVLSGC